MMAGGLHADDASRVLRVESEVFVEGDVEPVTRSLTLFCNGVIWDFCDPPGAGDSTDGDGPPGEIVLHDPARERVVLIDPVRNVKTQIDAIRLERLGVSLASWARRSDDRLVRWAGGPDFGDGFKEEDSRLELVGPRARYEVVHAAAPSPEAAVLYGKFADTAILLKALLQPGGIPPFPRLAINRRVAAAGGIPSVVRLEIDPRMAMLASRPQGVSPAAGRRSRPHRGGRSADGARRDGRPGRLRETAFASSGAGRGVHRRRRFHARADESVQIVSRCPAAGATGRSERGPHR
jgi:hypothetical protein